MMKSGLTRRSRGTRHKGAAPLSLIVCAGHGALLHRCKSYGQVLRRAEGKEKGKGVVARRGLEEAQSKAAGR